MAGLVCSFNIYPATLALYLMLHCLDVGEHIDLDVCIHAKSEGPFSCNLLCELENCDKTLSLPISGKVDVSPIMLIQFMCFICTKFQGPIVGVSVPYLNFGLVAVGRSHSLMFKVTSHTNCTLDYTLRQVVEGEEKNFIVSNVHQFDIIS